jgi:peptidoglycan/LPS O-acetylase OafA/YrhL
MLRKITFWLIWLGFSAYAFIFAPPDQPDTLELIKNLSIGQWEGINPLVISLFNIMGVWPMLYACLVFIDGRGQKIPAWLFASFSFGVGAFALLPYIALREPNPEFKGQKNTFIKILDSRITAILLSTGAIILVFYGVSQGNWSDFAYQWQTSRFIHVMSLDFCLLCLLFSSLVGDDMARRGMAENKALFWLTALVPLLGALVYLCVRKPLPEVGSSINQSQQKPAIT